MVPPSLLNGRGGSFRILIAETSGLAKSAPLVGTAKKPRPVTPNLDWWKGNMAAARRPRCRGRPTDGVRLRETFAAPFNTAQRARRSFIFASLLAWLRGANVGVEGDPAQAQQRPLFRPGGTVR